MLCAIGVVGAFAPDVLEARGHLVQQAVDL
jgi:hypothetical protein